MPISGITPIVAEFLGRRLIGRLATASPDGQPHVVPVWFLWEDDFIWISSFRTTRKVLDIEHNRKCAFVVDTEDTEGELTAVMLEGRADLFVNPPDAAKQRIARIYSKYLGSAGVLEQDQQNWLNSPENLLIRLEPTRIKTW